MKTIIDFYSWIDFIPLKEDNSFDLKIIKEARSINYEMFDHIFIRAEAIKIKPVDRSEPIVLLNNNGRYPMTMFGTYPFHLKVLVRLFKEGRVLVKFQGIWLNRYHLLYL